MNSLWIVIAILAPAALNVWATVAIVRDLHLMRMQKILQLVLTSVFPLIGAFATLTVQHFASRKRDRSRGDSSLVVDDQHYISKGYF